MKEYILLLSAVALFAAQFAFTRIYEQTVKQTVASALVLLTVTGLVGALQYLLVGGFQVAVTQVSLFWAALFALVMIPYYVVGIQVLNLGSLAVYSMFMMLGGMLVPFFYGILFLDEPLSWGKTGGTVLLVTCMILQAFWQPEPSGRKTSGWRKYLFFFLCIVIFLTNGMTGVIAKAHQISEGAVDEVSFTVLSGALTVVLSGALLPWALSRTENPGVAAMGSMLHRKPLFAMLGVGLAGNTGNYLLLLAADKVPASVQFPLVSGGVIVVSTLVSALVFREKLSGGEWISVAGALLATVLFGLS